MPKNRPSPPNHRKTGIAFLLLALLAITYLAFQPGLSGPFLLDDAANIPQTRISNLSWEEIEAKVLRSGGFGSLSRSLTWLSFSLTQYFDLPGAEAFKYQNLLIHLINGLLMFWLLSLLLSRTRNNTIRPYGQFLALAVTALWLLHPLQVSTVLYAVQRLVLLSSLFTLAALIAYVKGRILSQERPISGYTLSIFGVGLFGLLGIFSKETAVLIPLYILVIELYFFQFRFDHRRQQILFTTTFVLLVGIPLIAGGIYAFSLAEKVMPGYVGRHFNLAERLMTELHVLWLYLKLWVVPIPAQMSLYHDNFPVTRALDLSTAALAFLYLILVATAAAMRKHQPEIGFGILWFFIAHLLESTFIPLELVFEHRNYLALMGPSICLVYLMSIAARTSFLRRLLPAAFFGILILLGFNTHARSFAWSDKELLNHTQYLVRPDSPRVLSIMYNLALERGHREQALEYLEARKKLGLNHAGPQLNHILFLCQTPPLPDGLFEEAVHLLQNGINAPQVADGMEKLINLYLNDKCPSLTFVQIRTLSESAAQNQRQHTSSTGCLENYNHTRLLLRETDLQESRHAFEQFYKRCRHQPKGFMYRAVNRLNWIAMQEYDPHAVIELLNGLPISHGEQIIEIFQLAQ